MGAESTTEIVQRLIQNRIVISTRELAAEAGVSRQAAQKLLKAWVRSGKLTIEGKARAARYRRVDDSPSPAPVCDSSFRRAAQVGDFGSPYAAIPFVAPAAEPAPLRLDVASAGSLYRLSARMLLCDVVADEVILDFAGVMDVGDEFLEEVFEVWLPAHSGTRLIPVHVPAALAARIDAVTP